LDTDSFLRSWVIIETCAIKHGWANTINYQNGSRGASRL
jgi:hypothetical protein